MRHAAIHGQLSTRGETRRIRGEEEDNLRGYLGTSPSKHWHQVYNIGFEM
jgi:hypothetical protein